MKERLVGAAVLVALGVWLIPWILDGRNQVSTPAVVDETTDAVELPAVDEPARTQTRTIALNESQRPTASEASERAGVDARAEAAPAPEASTTPVASADAAGTAPRESTVAETEKAADDGAIPTAPEDRATGSVVADVPAETPADEATPVPAPAEGWYVQLGSFSDADNARRLAGRVEPFGYQADVSTYRAGGRTLNRVRVGPSKTREAAEAVASSLSAHGFVAQVVSSD